MVVMAGPPPHGAAPSRLVASLACGALGEVTIREGTFEEGISTPTRVNVVVAVASDTVDAEAALEAGELTEAEFDHIEDELLDRLEVVQTGKEVMI